MADKLWKATLPPPGRARPRRAGLFCYFTAMTSLQGSGKSPGLSRSHLGACPLGSDLLGLWALLEGSVLPARALSSVSAELYRVCGRQAMTASPKQPLSHAPKCNLRREFKSRALV